MAASAHEGEAEPVDVVVVGAGPAGLMAAQAAAEAGARVHVLEAMPSVARKFLLAGRGGLNLTHAEARENFVARYVAANGLLAPALAALPPGGLRAWADDLGADTFVGSSGRVFPRAMKASPLLRAWLARLTALGVRFTLRARVAGVAVDASGVTVDYVGADGAHPCVHARAVVLGLGGASWPRLGARGEWIEWLGARGVAIAPFEPANCGFECEPDALLYTRFAGTPIKNVAAAVGTLDRAPPRSAFRRGEFVLTRYGVEGGLVYALGAALRDALGSGDACLWLDLLPDRDAAWIARALAAGSRKRSRSARLERLGLEAAKRALLATGPGARLARDDEALAARIKALPLRVLRARPIAEAISSAGGVCAESVDADYALRALPGVYVCGEMLDWDAPTGGYLLTAVLGTGLVAGRAAARRARGTFVAPYSPPEGDRSRADSP